MTYLLHNIGDVPDNSNYNTLDEVLKADGKLTFDGVYRNVYKHRDDIPLNGVILFIMGDYVGKDNSFQPHQPLERFCTWVELHNLRDKYGAILGWHSWSHRDLTTLTDEELKKEVTPPFPMKHFAYPFGRFDDRVIQAVQDAGYVEAYSVTDGDNSQYQKLRSYL